MCESYDSLFHQSCAYTFLTVCDLDVTFFRCSEVVVMVRFIRVVSVRTCPDSVVTHSFDSKVSILNILVDIGARWMLDDLAGVDIVGCCHTRRLGG